MAKKPVTQKAKKPVKPLGKAITWTDDELDRLADITPADIEAAKARVESDAPALAKLLEAEQTEPNEGQPKK